MKMNIMINKLNRLMLIAIVFISLFLAQITTAQTPDELMNKASVEYQNENYAGAIEYYKNVLKQGFESGVLYYNLGNAYFKNGQLGYAIFSFEKALKLEPNDEDINYNLRIANSRTMDKIEEVPSIFILNWWNGLVTIFSLNTLAIFVLLFYLVLLTSILFYLYTRSGFVQKLTFFSGSISLSVFILFIVLFVARYNREATTNYGILFQKVYSVKTSPDQKASDAFIIHEGIKFTIEDHVNNWTKIRLNDGKIGWIEDYSFGRI